MDKQGPGRDAEKYVLRFPQGLRDQIQQAAKANRRSMNAEMIAIFEAHYGTQSAPDTYKKAESHAAGWTKRDELAMHFLASLINRDDMNSRRHAIKSAYAFADEMLAFRNEQEA